MFETESDPYSMFMFAMRSPKTREKCVGRLAAFFDFVEVPEGTTAERCKVFCEKGVNDKNVSWAFANILKFLQFQKERFERKEITAGTVKNYFQTIKLFCDMNDIPIPWKKISKGLPKVRKFADDRAPTIEEIRTTTEYPDRRIKAIVYTMASSGIRLGAWDYLRWKHVKPMENNCRIIAGKLIVYAGEDDEYVTFITREAYLELQKWKEYRILSGENVDDESWIMRNIWNTKKVTPEGWSALPLNFKQKELRD